MGKLRRILQELNNQKEDMEETLKQTQSDQGKKAKKEVSNWLQNVEKIKYETDDIEKEVNKGRYFSRARLGKLVEEKIEEVKEHREKGRVLISNSLVGVYGMGGIGKTTIMTPINKKLQKEANKFDHVIWVTVSQTLDHIKLQNDIAIALNSNLPREEDKIKRAGKLLQILEGKLFVLILDDLWEAFPLEEVGIPAPTEDNGCKLVITSRSRGVCRSMGCEEVRVQPLTKEDALNLFLDKVGQRFGNTIYEWSNALNELSENVRSVKGTDDSIFGRLEFSYNRLKDEKVQHCFLYCALYPEDFKIPKAELIDYWIAEGLLDEVGTVQAKYDRGHTILDRLENWCLLESANDGCNLKVHDLIRDTALRITSKSPLFMEKAGINLRYFPSEEEWKENLQKPSLMWNQFKEIPSNISPNCPSLSALLLQRNVLRRIPECFFVHMQGLKILDLSHTLIEDLPNSVSDLINLRSLLLRLCFGLRRIPSLEKVSALQYLDFDRTAIERVPEGLEKLKKLISLNLICRRLEEFPSGILPNLHCLLKLRVYFGPSTLRETVKEAAELSNQLDFLMEYFLGWIISTYASNP
ncbi:Disease resistance protein [Melia azedarach]|uniref:Disease resistance protein n=1 Tax=Melia azedarach TaxID=155640 RepID=A0ACC1Y7Q5_MELAZ|nr:Disease resistance protein [Melia azedarach]